MSWYICENCLGCFSAAEIAANLGFCPDCSHQDWREG